MIYLLSAQANHNDPKSGHFLRVKSKLGLGREKMFYFSLSYQTNYFSFLIFKYNGINSMTMNFDRGFSPNSHLDLACLLNEHVSGMLGPHHIRCWQVCMSLLCLSLPITSVWSIKPVLMRPCISSAALCNLLNAASHPHSTWHDVYKKTVLQCWSHGWAAAAAAAALPCSFGDFWMDQA